MEYQLNYQIEWATERVEAVRNILNDLKREPSNLELETFATYILRGKERGTPAENGEKTHKVSRAPTKYNTYRTAADRTLSLEELRENPLFDENNVHAVRSGGNAYVSPIPTIKRPKGDDPGDAIIPGMTDLWDTIDNMSAEIKSAERAARDGTPTLTPYKLYKLKHYLTELRQYQWYLKRAYQPTIRFTTVDHPRAQYID